MELYLAGEHKIKNGNECKGWQGLNILESYYYARNNKYLPPLIPQAQNFLLDSGAFTFMTNDLGHIDWDAYLREYARFVVKHDVKLFFELDIDAIVGLQEVERFRDKLEQLTQRKCIPVWHINRGYDYFLKMCEEYDYIAIGGLVSGGSAGRRLEQHFPKLLGEAHKRGTKVHGLGFTKMKGLKLYKFDSVDSTAWLYGNLGGFAYRFLPSKGEMEQIKKPQGARLRSSIVSQHNYNEWIKFMKYARTNL